MKRPTALVLGGGGARGALQVGALRALLEAGRQPELLVGTSIGAVNAAFLAVRGLAPASLEALAGAWREAAAADLLPANYLWLTVRSLFGRSAAYPTHRLRDFFVAHGLPPQLRFKDLPGPRLLVVAADLHAGGSVVYGQDPEDNLLEALCASTALPPWVAPLEKDGRLLMDGGTVSNLPIEPALAAGAREIVALDLSDPRDLRVGSHGFGPFLGKLIYTMEQRQQDLELALAAARGVPVTHIRLCGEALVALWDFQFTEALLERGHVLTRQALEAQRPVPLRTRWRSWRLARRPGRLMAGGAGRPRRADRSASEL